MSILDQIARDMREGTFPKKSEDTLREERNELVARAQARAHHHFQNTETHDLFIELAEAISALPSQPRESE
jgi:hypothetical protein